MSGLKEWQRKLVAYLLISIPPGFLANKFLWLYMQTARQFSFPERFIGTMLNYKLAWRNPLPSIDPIPFIGGLLVSAFFCLLLYTFTHLSSRKYRRGEEYGSARWGGEADIKPYKADKEQQNILLTKTERLMMEGRPKDPRYARNKNILVVGGSGSGKTRFFVKPNLMQLHSSYVVTDPKGTIIVECGKMFQKAGYKIKTFNTINFEKSMHYNPFSYIRSQKDVLKFVNALIANTKGEGEKAGEDFWVKAERLLYQAYVALIMATAPSHEQNLTMLLELINSSECREEDESFKNAVDLLFENLEQKIKSWDIQEIKSRENETEREVLLSQYGYATMAIRMYKKYKLAAGKTAKSIMISCGARLAPFDIDELREITSYDEMDLDMIGDRKSVLFVIISDTDDTFNFLVSIMYTQLFNLLCDRADDVYDGRLPVHVRFMLDEFANIGQIPKFDKLIATIRSREISACIILQAKSQLKSIYKDAAGTIIGNCDTELFLGGKEESTLKELSEILGKQTIDMFNTSDTRGQSRSMGTNYQKVGRELMQKDEIAVMDGGKCICQIRGSRAFLSEKYDITQHPRYKMLMDYDPENRFDIVSYMQHKPVKKRISVSDKTKESLKKTKVKVSTMTLYTKKGA